MLIHLIADYGVGDPAFNEVIQQLMMALPQAQIHPLSVSPFSTLATGFWVAQLGLNPGPGDRLIYHNCAPRQDDPQARVNNEGEGLIYAQLQNGVKVVGVNAGYTLSFIKSHTQAMHLVNVSRGGSQFRSRDVFPQAVAALAQNDLSVLGDAVSPDQLPDVPMNRVAWVDGYGNIKTTIPAHTVNFEPETKVVIRIGDVVSDAVFSDGSFEVPEGTLAFAPGSAGWTETTGQPPLKWMELFLRGGNAWKRFGRPRVGASIAQI